MVSGAIYHRDSTTLQLLTFTGESIDYTVAGVPDQPGVTEFQAGNLRPISVKSCRAPNAAVYWSWALVGPKAPM